MYVDFFVSTQCQAVMSTQEDLAKTVLVIFNDRRRPVKFSGEELKEQVIQVFSDVLPKEVDTYLQIKDETWGTFIDLQDQHVPDRSVLKLCVSERHECSKDVNTPPVSLLRL